MRMKVIHPRGLRYGGQDYGQGDEFDIIPSSQPDRYQVAALRAAKRAEPADPVVIGSPPALPRRRGRPPLSAGPAAAPEPVADTAEGARTKQTATTEEEAAKPAEFEAPKEETQPRLAPIQPQRVSRPTQQSADGSEAAAGDGTYQRRDLTAQE